MDALSEPVTIISDVHLRAGGDWARTLGQLRGLWKGSRTVVFNGDTMSRAMCTDDDLRGQVVRTLTDLCAADNARAVMLTGNSDWALGEARHLFLAAGRVLVTHGDVILDEISPWHGRGGDIAAAKARALDDMPPHLRDTLEAQLTAANTASRETELFAPARRHGEGSASQQAAWYIKWFGRPQAFVAVLNFWRRMPRLAATFLERFAPDARIMVLGHAHRPGVWTVSSRQIVNTGCFEGMWARALVVRVEGSRVEVRKVIRKEHGCLPGAVVACYDVAARGA